MSLFVFLSKYMECKEVSGMNQNSGDGFSERLYRNLPTEELQNKLRCEAFADGALDMELVDQILSELKRRNADMPRQLPEDAWQEFQSEYADTESSYEACAYAKPDTQSGLSPIKAKKHGRGFVIAAAAAAALLVSLVSVQAAGFDLWGTIARWTTELFGFGPPARQALVVDGKWPEIGPESSQTFDSLQDALDAYGVMEIMAPEWIPDGYVLQSAAAARSNVWLDFIAVYLNADQESLIISYCSSNDAAFAVYEKLASNPELSTLNDRAYYSVDNSENISVIWSTEHFECLITGPVTKAEGLKILDSIPG